MDYQTSDHIGELNDERDELIEALSICKSAICHALRRDCVTDQDSMQDLVDAECAARAALTKVAPVNGRTPQQEQELEIMRSRGEI